MPPVPTVTCQDMPSASAGAVKLPENVTSPSACTSVKLSPSTGTKSLKSAMRRVPASEKSPVTTNWSNSGGTEGPISPELRPPMLNVAVEVGATDTLPRTS